MNEKQPSGTSWRIWDLHVHTPESLTQQYGGNSDEVWARYLNELENLPKDIRVIGINDYWFIDGYRKIQAARKNGRLQNLDAVFPVIEMRLDQFGGTESNLSRVNLHVIFDADVDPDTIEAQFINALQPKVKLAPGHSTLGWNGVITKDSLADFGRRIKASVPENQLKNYGSDVEEGFNNLNVSFTDVQSALDSHYFKGKTLIGVGKTEWANIKWTDQSIAAKKHTINSADFIFSAFEDVSRWGKDVDLLRANNVNHKLLDCSDAHHFSDSKEHIKLGACQTWMNTPATLAGLAYALEEFERRVFVGLEPPALGLVRKNPERFISRIEVTSDETDSKLFDHQISLNTGFIAIVGNKGQGKSALLDCIALAGNSSRKKEFAFLTPKRFLSPTSVKSARTYYSELEWATGKTRRIALDQDPDRTAPVSVEYLPQAFVERVCNIDPATGDADEFERELRAVLFTHIGDEDRAGEKTFDNLLSQKTRTSTNEITRLREGLRNTIAEFTGINDFRNNNPLIEVKARLTLKETEVAEAKVDLKEAQDILTSIDISSADNEQLEALKRLSLDLEIAREALRVRQSNNEQQQAKAHKQLTLMESISKRAETLRSDIAALNSEAESVLGEGAGYLKFSIDHAQYDNWKNNELALLATTKADHETVSAQLAEQEKERQKNADALAAADSARELARQHVLQSEERVSILVGNEAEETTLLGLRALVSRVTNAPTELSKLRTEILNSSRTIHEALVAQLDAVSSLYAPASHFIVNSEVVKSAGLEFNAELRILPNWQSIASNLDGRRNGTFSDWLNDVPLRVEDTSWPQLSKELDSALDRMHHERGDLDAPLRNPADALRTTTTLENFLESLFDLSWLEVRFGLTGDGLPLSQLSPGQRGLVLALFYLVVDRRTTPLLLDQPEENLDNATIASKLVPAIHEASGRRQTIVVTHNANLAIVGDADQIIHCQLDQSQFRVTSGSIAELDVARFALEVLEGTKPAFDNRRYKYEAFPELVN